MNENLQELFDNLWGSDRTLQNEAFFYILSLTDQPVNWAYAAWDEVIANLNHKDNHNRAIAGQLLSSLAKSDPENRLVEDFNALFKITRDHRFVTARHTMQSLWKVGAENEVLRKLYLDAMEIRYKECIKEKQCRLIRFDILTSMRKVYDLVGDDVVMEKAIKWIEQEDNLKYRKKYTRVWKSTKT